MAAYQRPILDVTFPAVDTGIVAGAVVVMGTDGRVVLPSATAVTKIVGVANEAVANTSVSGVSVRIAGIAECISDGSAVINEGDYLVIADNTGKVKTATMANTGALNGVVGLALTPCASTSGLKVDVLLQPGLGLV